MAAATAASPSSQRRTISRWVSKTMLTALVRVDHEPCGRYVFDCKPHGFEDRRLRGNGRLAAREDLPDLGIDLRLRDDDVAGFGAGRLTRVDDDRIAHRFVVEFAPV